MLIQDGEKTKLTPEQLKMIESLTGGKWPVMFRYMNSMYTPNPDNNNKPDFPRSITLPVITPMLNENKDQVFLQYAESSSFKPDGSGKRIEDFNPKHIDLKERITVNENQKDLFWFLWNNSRNATGPSSKLAKTHYFIMEDLNKEAMSFVDEKGLELSVGFAIMSNDGLPEERLRIIAGAYYLPNADTAPIAILRKQLYSIIFMPEKRTNKPNPETLRTFNTETKSDKIILLKSKIQKAVDLGIITYKNDKKKWFWVDDQGNLTSTICAAPNPVKSREELFTYLSLRDKAKEAKEFMDEVDKVHKAMQKEKVKEEA